MLAVRTATSHDIGAVDALLRRSYGPLLRADYPPSALVLALPVMARAQPRLLTAGRYFLAEEGAAILGAGGWSAEAPGGERVTPGLGHVRHVATDARVARQGIGRAVMEDARGAGMRRLSSLSTLIAVPFYQALGFTALQRRDLSFGAGVPIPTVEMEREL